MKASEAATGQTKPVQLEVSIGLPGGGVGSVMVVGPADVLGAAAES
jgi:hypothetical protein